MPLLLNRTYQRILLILTIDVLLVAGLYPFNFVPKNQVSWIPSSRGVMIHRHAEIVGPSPLGSLGVTNSRDGSDGVTIELWITSLNEDPDVKDLLSVYVSRSHEPFAVEEWQKQLIVGGVFRDADGHRKFRHLGVKDALVTGARRFVTITSGPNGTKIYLEGKLQVNSPELTLEPDNFDGTLILGQTASGWQEWRGSFRGLAFYRKELTPAEVSANFEAWESGNVADLEQRNVPFAVYAFDDHGGTIAHRRGDLGADLSVPKRLVAVDPVILERPSRSDFTNVSDVVINLLGFIPFGGLLTIYLRTAGKRSRLGSAAMSVLAGFLLSVMIELLQVLLPSRDSSLLDVINNTLGTAIGAGLGLLLLAKVMKNGAYKYSPVTSQSQ